MKNYLLIILLVFNCWKCSSEETKPVKEDPKEELPHDTFVTVPENFETIQEALNQSKDGDTIVVKPGTYEEHINFNGKDVLLTSLFYESMDVDYITSTIIKGSNNSVVKFMKAETNDAIIQGFTITGGTGSVYTRPNGNITLGGGGILGLNSSPTIRYNIIENNEATDVSGSNPFAGGGGIRLELGTPHVHNNIIRNNKGGFGGGVFLDATAAEFTNNLIVGNSAIKSEFAGGGGLYLDYVKPNSTGNKIFNNTIVGNFSVGEGGGLVLAGNTVFDDLLFVNNIISNNENKEILARNEASESDFAPDYCMIDGGFSGGTEIIDEDPMIEPETYLLMEQSPCIDKGDPAENYEDKSEGENAILPSRGTSRNDIGVFGGPGAFQILK